jgi:acyl phosphate:glycerol-3-phosphate acyltransferase
VEAFVSSVTTQTPALFAESAAWAAVAVGFLLGSIPFGLILALLFGKTDVRTAGSGNIGATNVARVVGRKLEVLTLLLDCAKGAAPVLLVGVFAARLSKDAPTDAGALLGAWVGLSAVLGHCFTPWLRFRGGKGVATGLGMMLAVRPEVAAYALLAFGVAFAASRLVSVSSLAAALVAVVALFYRGPVDAVLLPILLAFTVIIGRHHQNLRRLARRTELKV